MLISFPQGTSGSDCNSPGLSKSMLLQDHIIRIISLCQIAVGLLGNGLCLFLYSLAKLTNHKLRPMDAILAQLALANAILLLSKGIPEALLYFRSVYFLGNYGCKLIFYIQRVSRGSSICTTWLLSAFQAVFISPNSSRLAILKTKSTKCMRPTCVLCWIFTMLIDIYVPMYITGPKDSNQSHIRGMDLQYCYWENVLSDINFLPSLRDLLFVSCMSFASSYMVFLLHRHRQRTQQIHSTRPSPRSSPEIKATQTILLLVGSFITTYCVSCGFLLLHVYSVSSSIWGGNASLFVTLCFPVISPFLLIHIEGNQSSCAPCWRTSPHPQQKS
ncbi:vomeronasal type-1 receptor 4-like [Sarcophilus harrisii]|uniref:vomeronasal type-1 receptor 4-like n=1 Tax=Sarcophilus harrisii TaxID=9305 RepID=UPI001301AD7A|nr:vomeronasal type-1 receptor 4-like [Sarcophilus harrisii]